MRDNQMTEEYQPANGFGRGAAALPASDLVDDEAFYYETQTLGGGFNVAVRSKSKDVFVVIGHTDCENDALRMLSLLVRGGVPLMELPSYVH
jgi:hypothetical protein